MKHFVRYILYIYLSKIFIVFIFIFLNKILYYIFSSAMIRVLITKSKILRFVIIVIIVRERVLSLSQNVF